MKNKIHYSPESRRALDDIWDYIVSELQNRSAAERVVDRIMDAVDQLKNFAEMETPIILYCRRRYGLSFSCQRQLYGVLPCARQRCLH